MKILITSGGTKVPIDPVRDISNHSRGTFGSKIAKVALGQFHEVYYYVAEQAATPFTINESILNKDEDKFLQKARDLFAFRQKHGERYCESTFRNFDDYAAGLPKILDEYKPDIVMLAAAVSDYLVEPIDTKLRSEEDLKIEMYHAEKIISKVKEWAPNVFLTGFKLMVGCSLEELEEAAWSSIEKNGCDLVIANEWWKLKNGNHTIMSVWHDPLNNDKRVLLTSSDVELDPEWKPWVQAKEVLNRSVSLASLKR